MSAVLASLRETLATVDRARVAFDADLTALSPSHWETLRAGGAVRFVDGRLWRFVAGEPGCVTVEENLPGREGWEVVARQRWEAVVPRQ